MEREYNVGTWLTPSDEYIKDIKQTLVEKGVATELTPNEELSNVIKGNSFLKPFFDLKKSMNYEFHGRSSLTYEQLTGILNYDDTSNVKEMAKAFYGCTSLTSIPQINTSNVTDMRDLFYGCSRLENVPQLDTSKVNYAGGMFYNCYQLKTIPQLDLSNVTDLGNTFYGCSRLKEILATGMKVNFNISYSTDFTRENLVTILNNLATVTSTVKLTMGSTNLAKLTEEDKAIATNKGWTLA